MMRALWIRTAVDFAVLPAAMLATQKAWSKVEHDRHDALIAEQLGEAISTVERRANISIHPATYRTTGYSVAAIDGPCACPLNGYGWRLPHNNVNALRLFDDTATDVTNDWEAVQEHFGGNAEAYAASPTNTGAPVAAAIEIDVGTDDPTKLDPAVVQAIRKLAASLYENREANLPLTDAGFDAELIQVWRPTA